MTENFLSKKNNFVQFVFFSVLFSESLNFFAEKYGGELAVGE